MENNTTGTANTSLNDGASKLFTEQFSVSARVAFLLVGLLALTINIPAIIVLRKTKKVPYAGKLLSSGLLIFDALFIFFTTLRKFFSDPMVNNTLQLLGTTSNGLSVISVSMMAAERYALFFYPMKYLKYMTPRLTRILAFIIWVGYGLMLWILRYGVCYAKLRTVLVFMQAGICNGIVLNYMLACVTITTLICIYSYANIIAFVYRKTKTSAIHQHIAARRSIVFEYKSTMFVFMCTGVMCISFVAYAIILVLNVTRRITIEENRIAYESVSIMNCIMDPLWYVLWFNECRLEALKILAIFNHKLLPKVEKMRIEIFNIVTSVPCGAKAIIEEHTQEEMIWRTGMANNNQLRRIENGCCIDKANNPSVSASTPSSETEDLDNTVISHVNGCGNASTPTSQNNEGISFENGHNIDNEVCVTASTSYSPSGGKDNTLEGLGRENGCHNDNDIPSVIAHISTSRIQSEDTNTKGTCIGISLQSLDGVTFTANQ